MSQDNQTNEEKYQNKNNLEKIIKLDKKNGNFDIYDKYSKRKLKIRTSQKNQYINGAYQNEFTLCYFWRHINSVYFKKIDEPELERFDYLKSLTADEIHSEFPIKYSDYKIYQAMNILNKQQLKQENKIYYENIVKHIQLAGMIHSVQDHKYDKIFQQKQKLMSKCKSKNYRYLNNNINYISLLIQENTQLDKLIDKMSTHLDSKKDDQIGDQLDELNAELQELNKNNKKDLGVLSNKIKSDHPINIFSQQSQKSQGKPKQVLYSNEALLEYLRISLQQLDYRQTAESITKIVSTIHSSNRYNFVIQFEQALNPSYVTIDEDMMLDLDRLRDTSLFKFYNIPQKTKYSHIAQNFLGIQQVSMSRLKPNPFSQKNMYKDIKQTPSIVYENDQILAKFEACHHCKMLFREEYLISCNYKSGTMGLPTINQTITDSYLFAQSELYNQFLVEDVGIQTKRQVPNRKKTAYSIYIKKNGELVCNRKFCRMCLKQNYETNYAEVALKNDWVCPFCQASCFCSRCQRNDIMIKLKDLYTICGGDLEMLKRDSIFEKYIRPLTDDQLYRRKSHQLQRTGSSFLKQQMNNFKDMQNIRLHFENLRLLCSQVLRREKMKYKNIEIEMLLWQKQLETHKNKEQKAPKTPKTPKTSQVEKQKQKPVKQLQKIRKISKKQEKVERNNFEMAESSQELSQSSSSSLYNVSEDEYSDQVEKPKVINKKVGQQLVQKKKKKAAQFKRARKPYAHIVNNFKSFPSQKIKREVAQLLSIQDSDTYNLVVKKIKEDNKLHNKK